MLRLTGISNLSFSTLTKGDYNNIKDSKHSPVYRRRGAEGFSPLFSFLFVYLNNMKGTFKLVLASTCLLCIMLLNTTLLYSQSVKPYINYAWFDEDNAIAGGTTTLVNHVKVRSCVTNMDTTVIGHLHYYYKTQKTIAEYGNNFAVHVDIVPGLIDTIYPTGILKNLDFLCDTNFIQPRLSDTGPLNVIIIWPAFSSVTVSSCDSGMYILPNILIDNPGLTLDVNGNAQFGSTVYPNPAEETQLVVINSNYTEQMEKVSILNTLGQPITTKVFAEGEDSKGYILPTAELKPSVYYIQISYKDQKTEVVKFVKK